MSTPTPVQAVETGVMAWLKKNWGPLATGFGTGMALWYVVHKFL